MYIYRCLELSESERLSELFEFLGDDDPEIRRKTKVSLVDNGDKIFDSLLPYLEDDDLRIVSDAIWVLERIEDQRITESLIDLLDHESSSIRKKAAKALSKLGGDALAKTVDQLSEVSVNRRRIASWILPEFENSTIGEDLFSSLQDTDPVVRRNAARAIGLLDVDKAVKPLRGALSDKDWRVRMWAAFSLGLISQKKGATQGLIKALSDESLHVQYAAVIALGNNEVKSSVNRLLKIIENTDDMILRCAAVKSLGYIGSHKAVQPLIKLYYKSDYYIQCEILLALGRTGGANEIYDVIEDSISKKDLRDVSLIALSLLDTRKAKKIMKEIE